MRLIRQGDRERGDTIIEVLFAVTVFAMIAVGSILIMNQAMATAQRSLEITLVRQQIDAQAEAIRYIHQAYVANFRNDDAPLTGAAAEWSEMTDPAKKGASKASEFGVVNGNSCLDETPGEKPFVLNARTARIWNGTPEMQMPTGVSLPPFAQVSYNGTNIDNTYGIWIEAVPSSGSSQTGFVDFHIRACWQSPGATAPMTLGTIVRLYEPR